MPAVVELSKDRIVKVAVKMVNEKGYNSKKKSFRTGGKSHAAADIYINGNGLWNIT